MSDIETGKTSELKDTTRRLGEAPLGKLLLQLSLPAMGSMITLALYNLVDTFWVAKLGYQAIAALTVVIPFHILAIAVSVGSGIGINSLVSRRFGERNVKAANRAAGQVFPIAVFFGAVFLISAVFFPETILTISGATPDIVDLAAQYLVIIGLGMPFLIFMIIANGLLRGSGEAVKPMAFMVTATVTNIILDPFLIFGYGPFPEMGIRGAALATAIAYLLGAGLCFYYIVGHKSVYRMRLRSLIPSIPMLRDIYRVGLPSMVIEIMESVVFAILNFVLSSFGSIALAAAGLMIRVIDLAFMPIFGASTGLLPIIGFCFGAGLWHRLWRAVKLASGGLMLLLGIATVVMEIFSPQLVGIFSRDPELVAIAVPAMRICLSTLIFIGPAVLFVTTFQGLSKGKDALFLSLVRQLIFFVPLLFLLRWVWGMTGVWLSLPISDTLAFIVSGLWLFREYRRRQGMSPVTPSPEIKM
jgi:putative MATE family efflux protein